MPPPARFPLEGDSFVLMVSDGVADSTEDEWLQNFLAGWQGSDRGRYIRYRALHNGRPGGWLFTDEIIVR